MVTFGGLHIIRSIVAGMFGFGWFMGGWHRGPYFGPDFPAFGPGIAIISLIGLLGFVLWIYCMVRAFRGESFMLPISGEIAANIAGRP
jgi:uncharacterized membrane protein